MLALATCDGAKALGLGDLVGVLAPGCQADIAVVDARGPHLGPEPEHDPYAALVHAARPSDVRLTVVAGRVLYRDGAWTTLDPASIGTAARAERAALLRRAELQGAA